MEIGVGIALGNAIRHRRGRFVAARGLAVLVIIVIIAAVFVVAAILDVLGVSTHMLVVVWDAVAAGRWFVVVLVLGARANGALGHCRSFCCLLGGCHLGILRRCCCRYRGAIRAAGNRHVVVVCENEMTRAGRPSLAFVRLVERVISSARHFQRTNSHVLDTENAALAIGQSSCQAALCQCLLLTIFACSCSQCCSDSTNDSSKEAYSIITGTCKLCRHPPLQHQTR